MTRTYEKTRRSVYWRNQYRDVRDYVAACGDCQSGNRMIGARSKATLAYRPQSNGMTERMVQSIVHAIKLYVADPDQRDWDEYAERLVFAINSSYDRVRKETPHYLMHG